MLDWRGMRMSAKIDITPLLRRQFATFRGYSRRSAITDGLVFVGIPVASGAATVVLNLRVRNIASVLGDVAIFTALLFSLLVAVFNLSIKLMRDEDIRPEQSLARNTAELFANVAWSVLVGLALVVVMAAAA